MKTAIVHDWLTTFGGSELVLKEILETYPSPIFTLFYDEKFIEDFFSSDTQITPSFLQKIPFIEKTYRNLLPVFPRAIESFGLSGYDLILSSSHSVAKGVLTTSEQLHICYCSSPMRYVWDLYFEHLNGSGTLKKILMQILTPRLRAWDLLSAPRVDHFIANSRYIAKRIAKVYGRTADVIYPPVDVDQYFLSKDKEEYYITISRLVPYKRVDLMVEAFQHLPDRKLLILGDGPEMQRLKKIAPKNVELLGFVKQEQCKILLSKARAFLFMAKEDFGISPVEAQSAGVPVIAYGKGGTLETVLHHKTGLFFEHQTAESLLQAIAAFEKYEEHFDPMLIRSHALQFSKERFKREYFDFVTQKTRDFYESDHSGRRERDPSLAHFE